MIKKLYKRRRKMLPIFPRNTRKSYLKKCSIEMDQTDHQTDGCQDITTQFTFSLATIRKPDKLIKKARCMKGEVCVLEAWGNFLRVYVCVYVAPPLESLFSHSDLKHISVIIQTGICPCHIIILIPVYLTEHFARRVSFFSAIFPQWELPSIQTL